MEKWMREEFQKRDSDAEHYPVFAELFMAVFNSILNGEKIDALDFPNQLLEADDPPAYFPTLADADRIGLPLLGNL